MCCMALWFKFIEQSHLEHAVMKHVGARVVDIAQSEIITGIDTQTRSAYITEPCTPGKINRFKIIRCKVGFGTIGPLFYIHEKTQLWACFQPETVAEHILQQNGNVHIIEAQVVFSIVRSILGALAGIHQFRLNGEVRIEVDVGKNTGIKAHA